MRRGLISWSKDEVPEQVLIDRVRALQDAMKHHQLAACVAYTSIAQPSAVNWLTHFTPYWSEALLVILPSGPPVLLASLTKRVHTWIHEVSLMGEIIMAPKLGENAQAFLNDKLATGSKVGVVGLESLPGSIASVLVTAGGAQEWVDASAMFADLRMRSDACELALVKKAERIAQAAFSALADSYTESSSLAAALELQARLGGAEEVIIRIAPDLTKDAVFRRLEGELPLSGMYSVELSVAYKGVWIRLVENYADEATTQDWSQLKTWWSQVVEDYQFNAATTPVSFQGKNLKFTRLESCQTTCPLDVVDLKTHAANTPIGWGVLSTEIKWGHAHWPASQTVYAA